MERASNRSKLDQAFHAADRREFLPDEMRVMAYQDAPISIGFGQTNSQPYTVRSMLEWLDPQKGEKILDIGSGSGWTSALLAYLVGKNGVVYAVERIPELYSFGAENCRRLGINNVHFFQATVELGLPKYAPYDRILVSAAAQEIPSELIKQLKSGGRMVVPVLNSIFVVDKKPDQQIVANEHPGFTFVPLL